MSLSNKKIIFLCIVILILCFVSIKIENPSVTGFDTSDYICRGSDQAPVCKNVGTRSEGWYGKRDLIRYASCDGCTAVFKRTGGVAGWYSSCDLDFLICELADCTTNADCPHTYYSDNYCLGNEVYHKIHNFFCLNPTCIEEVANGKVETCSEGFVCEDGECVEELECEIDDDCNEGYECIGNECVEKEEDVEEDCGLASDPDECCQDEGYDYWDEETEQCEYSEEEEEDLCELLEITKCEEYSNPDMCSADECGVSLKGCVYDGVGCYESNSELFEASGYYDCEGKLGPCSDGKMIREPCDCIGDCSGLDQATRDEFEVSKPLKCTKLKKFPFFDNFSLLITILLLTVYYIIRKKFLNKVYI